LEFATQTLEPFSGLCILMGELGPGPDTSEFACDSIAQWWRAEGRDAFPTRSGFQQVQQVQHYMSKAATRTGLQVVVNILDKVYQAGRKVAAGFKQTMRIVFDNVLPRFNYRALPAQT
jgi:hypothetical protein